MKKKVKIKSDFLKIAQGLGIAIPASLFFATNANAMPAKIRPLNNVQIIVQSVEGQSSNAVINRIILNVPNNDEKQLAHTDTHTNETCCPHCDMHANTIDDKGKHTNTNPCPHCDCHKNIHSDVA